jgi:hypothetical protein
MSGFKLVNISVKTTLKNQPNNGIQIIGTPEYVASDMEFIPEWETKASSFF